MLFYKVGTAKPFLLKITCISRKIVNNCLKSNIHVCIWIFLTASLKFFFEIFSKISSLFSDNFKNAFSFFRQLLTTYRFFFKYFSNNVFFDENFYTFVFFWIFFHFLISSECFILHKLSCMKSHYDIVNILPHNANRYN